MPRPKNAVQDPFLLAAALEGLELKKRQIEDQIRTVRAMMGQRTPAAAAVALPKIEAVASAAPKSGGRRELSAAARKRIAAAQKKRWAEFRKKKAAAAGE